MLDPVTTPDGHFYDRAQILRIIEETGQDPITYNDLTAAQLIPQPELKARIEAYLRAHPEVRGT
jgi:hypothetical protein